jgi:hypothetical protein
MNMELIRVNMARAAQPMRQPSRRFSVLYGLRKRTLAYHLSCMYTAHHNILRTLFSVGLMFHSDASTWRPVSWARATS